jgi:glycine cleavage system transcriptional repressor
MTKASSVLTVVGKDRPGIIAKVTEVLYRSGCNLQDMSMTILEQELAMMVIVSMEPAKKSAIEKKLSGLVKELGLSFFWKDLKNSRWIKSGKHQGLSCLITAIGRDRTGIVYEISRLMAKQKLNITDLNSRVLGAGTGALYAMMLEVDMPRNVSMKKLSSRLQALAKKLKIEVQVKPVERIEF